MATVNHVRRAAIGLQGNATEDAIQGAWTLTRTLKKAGWKYKASGFTTKDTSGDPAADLWNGTIVTSNAGASAASIAAPTRGRASVTGLSGIVAADKGRFLLISGGATGANNNQHQIEEIISATEVRIDARNFAVASDANNGSLAWSISDPATEDFFTFGGSNSNGWWCAEGPSVLKIPITAASAGVFTRGENIVQASTGAEGELAGYTYYNGTGWLVVAPRLRGTGSGVYGWDTGNLITGSRSGATVTQAGTAQDYVCEMVLAKPNNRDDMHLTFNQVDRVGESTELFSVLATAAGCTNVIQPGGGGTGNTFPVHAWVAWGKGTAANVDANPFSHHSLLKFSRANIICVDAIPEQNYSADGSWMLNYWSHQSSQTFTPVTGSPTWGFQRLEETEDGEVSLYVAYAPVSLTPRATPNRTSSGNPSAIAGLTADCDTFVKQNIYSGGATYSTGHTGWEGRGLAAENFMRFVPVAKYAAQNNLWPLEGYLFSDRVLSSANPLLRPKEKIWLTNVLGRSHKGRFRWLYWVNGGRLAEVYGEDPGWLQLSYGIGSGAPTSDTSLSNEFYGGGAMIMGPWDGTPISMQQPVLF